VPVRFVTRLNSFASRPDLRDGKAVIGRRRAISSNAKPLIAGKLPSWRRTCFCAIHEGGKDIAITRGEEQEFARWLFKKAAA